MNDKTYQIKLVFHNSYDDISIELVTSEFNEPTIDDIQDINTTKQLVYYLSEMFGDSLYEYMDQEILDMLDEIELEDISDVMILDVDENITYYINPQRKTIDVE